MCGKGDCRVCGMIICGGLRMLVFVVDVGGRAGRCGQVGGRALACDIGRCIGWNRVRCGQERTVSRRIRTSEVQGAGNVE